LGLTPRGFWYIIDRHRNLKSWKRNDQWEWELIQDPLALPMDKELVEAARLPKKEDCDFVITKSRRPGFVDNEYVLVGKGYVEP